MLPNKRVLVALEDEIIGRQLCEFIRMHDWSPEAEFMLVHVVEPPLEENLLQLATKLREAETQGKDLLKQFGQSLRATVKSGIKEKLAIGRPIDELLHEINAWSPDLLILGSYGRIGVSKWCLGSVSETLTELVRCPVLLLRPTKVKDTGADKHIESTSDTGYSKILVCVEDMKQSKLVLDQLVNHKWPSGTQFIVSHIVDRSKLFNTGFGAIEQEEEQAKAYGHMLVNSVAKRIRSEIDDCSVEEIVSVGNVSEDLLEQASRLHIDLMLLSSRCRSLLGRLLFGSVARPVIEQAPCTVMIISGTKGKR